MNKYLSQNLKTEQTFEKFKKNTFKRTPWFKFNQITPFALKNQKKEIKEIIFRADSVLKNIFFFTDRWDMERCSTPITMLEINWNYDYHGDFEWSYALVRFNFYKDLAYAYAFTKDEKYFFKAQELLLDFIQKEPYNQKRENSTWRTIDTGIRMSNILQAIILFRESKFFDFNLFKILINFLITHFDFLMNVYEDWKKLSNWGVIQTLPLIEFSSIFTNSVNSENLMQIEKRFEDSAQIQIYNDGSHWERSPMYHNEVLDIFSRAINLYHWMGQKWSKKFTEIVKKMHEYNLYISKPNRHQPMQGDSDDTLLFDRFQVGALLFNRGDLKSLSPQKLELRVILTYGYWTINRWKEIATFKPLIKNKLFPEAGNVYLRKNWNKKADWLWFSAGPVGSGHGHGDLLHLSLDYAGQSFFIDPGRYTYHPTSLIRNQLKNNENHNTTTINNQNFQIFEGSWSTIFSPRYEPIYFQELGSIQYLESGHFGYQNYGVHINRGIINIWDNFTLIIDFATDSEQKWLKNLQQNWVLDNEVKIKNQEGGSFQLINQKTNVFMKTLAPSNCKISKIEISKFYNELLPSTKITFSTQKKNLLTIISKEKKWKVNQLPILQNNKTLIKEDTALAYSLKNGQEEYILYFAFQEITQGKKIVFVDNFPLYGRVIIVDKKQEIIYRLK